MHPWRQPNLLLILARELASRLATALFILDPGGTVIYFNEAAGQLLGWTYGEGTRLGANEWSRSFESQEGHANAAPMEELSLGAALAARRPTHGALQIVGADGAARDLRVATLPLSAYADEFVGTMAFVWEPSGRMTVPRAATTNDQVEDGGR